MVCLNRLTDMLLNYEGILGAIPVTISPMMRPFIERVEEVLNVGVSTLSWTSLQHESCEFNWFMRWLGVSGYVLVVLHAAL